MEIVVFENTSEDGRWYNSFYPERNEYLCDDGDVVSDIAWDRVSAYLCELPEGYRVGEGVDGFNHLYKDGDVEALDDWPIEDHTQGYLLDMYTDFAVIKKIRELKPSEVSNDDPRRIGVAYIDKYGADIKMEEIDNEND